MKQKQEEKPILEIRNRKAAFEYHFREIFEAGIQLLGTEIKSIRAGFVNLNDAYCTFSKGELLVRSLYIKEYDNGTHTNHEARRARKLLLRKSELRKLEKKVKERGFTIVPIRLYVTQRGLAKLEVALAQGKKQFDKRQTMKDRDNKRQLDRIKKRY